jgi:S-formylglutathione hydrolase FrmB
MRPWTLQLAGRLETRELTADALRDNPLGDSATRPLWVYLPPGYDESSQRYPVIYVLQGFGGFVTRWGQRALFDLTVPELIDTAFQSGAPPCVVVYVDAWTSLGGSQFLDSPGTGRYHTYLCEDVVAFVDGEYRTTPEASHRAVMGHSSGGYGAIVAAMLRPDRFSAFGSLAGDCCFELSLLPDLARAYRALRDHYDGSYERFFNAFRQRPAMSEPDDFALVMVWALAACYSAEDDGSVTLPFDTATGAVRDAVWSRWLACDPVRMVPHHVPALRSLRGIWVDAGRRDEHLLDVGAEILVSELRRAGVDDLSFELFAGSHYHNTHRYPRAVSYLAERISAPA